MEQFAEDFGITGLTNVVDEDGSIWAAFKVPQFPSTAVVYPDGYVVPSRLADRGATPGNRRQARALVTPHSRHSAATLARRRFGQRRPGRSDEP